MTDGIIFDLDGTLWDSCGAVTDSWNETLRKYYGGKLRFAEWDIRAIMGMTPKQITETLFSEFGEEAGKVSAHCMAEECAYCALHGGRLYPGLEETLRLLSAEHRIFIVSNCQRGYIECFLEYTGFGRYFTDFLCQAETGRSKGENILALTAGHALRAPVYIGDTASDRAAADFAGCTFILAEYGFGADVGAAHRISTLSELPALIAGL